jgi:hypothetical protein
MAHNSRETPHSPRSASSYPVSTLHHDNVNVLDKPNVHSHRTKSEKLLLTRDFSSAGHHERLVGAETAAIAGQSIL